MIKKINEFIDIFRIKYTKEDLEIINSQITNLKKIQLNQWQNDNYVITRLSQPLTITQNDLYKQRNEIIRSLNRQGIKF